jgi:hypothetical protein
LIAGDAERNMIEIAYDTFLFRLSSNSAVMNNERIPLLKQDGHFEISCTNPTSNQENAVLEASSETGGASVFQTSLNIAKLCMGTGTLALPFAAQKGGLVFNMIGLGVIVVWNYYSADCLLGCFENLPSEATDTSHHSCSIKAQEQKYDSGGTEEVIPTANPPEETTTYGIIVYHAFGKAGLILLDSLMMMLSVGLLIAYQAAIFSFVDGITQNTCTRIYDKILPTLIITVLSCAKDISFLSKFSVCGLLALALSFG